MGGHRWMHLPKYPKELYNTRFYKIWSNMKTRCYNENIKEYYRYGGRGITVCDKWQTFGGFFDDMFESYDECLSLDRIDNDGNYCKSNCKWSTKREQANNRKTNRFIEWNGMVKTLEEWGRVLNIKSSCLRQRYYCLKWDVDKCFTYNKGELK
jgi:hypothetical protein